MNDVLMCLPFRKYDSQISQEFLSMKYDRAAILTGAGIPTKVLTITLIHCLVCLTNLSSSLFVSVC